MKWSGEFFYHPHSITSLATSFGVTELGAEARDSSGSKVRNAWWAVNQTQPKARRGSELETYWASVTRAVHKQYIGEVVEIG